MKNLINAALGILDAKLVRKSTHDKLVANAHRLRDYELSALIDPQYLGQYFDSLAASKSQLRQDLFVLSELGFKQGGYFVEFGATDGVKLSNTHLLETKFNWDGILAEPARTWHSSLKSNRSAAIETDCVWHTTGERLLFNEVHDRLHDGELSTIDRFSNSDQHRSARAQANTKYEVTTISLGDMLGKHGAPRQIDYLSIDTEGSEFEILESFDFDDYDIKIIKCEHNYTEIREKVHALLSKKGYSRKLSDYSLFEDWYVKT